ncbi:hypothetical protein M569_10143 [Genlisea aurea]|uniref:Uncharacterized protein n=1 Tax=Genlisea aurea TaxID=192259 RepID=S8CIY5_9LAMI|nr:hypothetical protein M569_10143 [Genlisea aurea]
MPPQPRRKKWTEAEERTLIEKYWEMASDGTLSKMRTREKKYRPIAFHVNSVHHLRDPVAYQWHWTWKDVSTKVQNMRHQYALVKQKIRKPECSLHGSAEEEYDWMEGITHWSNFLRYKEVFGDIPLGFMSSGEVGVGSECNGGGFEGGDNELDILQFDSMVAVGEGDFVGAIDSVANGVMDLEFHYDGDEGEEKSMENAGTGFLKQLELRLEQRHAERDEQRQKRESEYIEKEKEHEREKEINRQNLRRQWLQECEAIMKENEETEKTRIERESKLEMEFEERLNRKRSDWKKTMDEMIAQHRAEMNQIQARILHDQETITNQFVGIVSQWASSSAHHHNHHQSTSSHSHYLSQMIQNLQQHSNAHGDECNNNQEGDQFIVDG